MQGEGMPWSVIGSARGGRIDSVPVKSIGLGCIAAARRSADAFPLCPDLPSQKVIWVKVQVRCVFWGRNAIEVEFTTEPFDLDEAPAHALVAREVVEAAELDAVDVGPFGNTAEGMPTPC